MWGGRVWVSFPVGGEENDGKSNLGIDQKMSPKEQHEFDGWLKTNAVLGSILTIGMMAMALAGSNSAGRSDAAMAASTKVAAFK